MLRPVLLVLQLKSMKPVLLIWLQLNQWSLEQNLYTLYLTVLSVHLKNLHLVLICLSTISARTYTSGSRKNEINCFEFNGIPFIVYSDCKTEMVATVFICFLSLDIFYAVESTYGFLRIQSEIGIVISTAWTYD